MFKKPLLKKLVPKKQSTLPSSDKTLTGSVLLENFSRPYLLLMKGAVAAGILSTLSLCVMWVSFSMLASATIVKGEALFEHFTMLACYIVAAFLKVIAIRVQTGLGDQASAKIRSNVRLQILDLWRKQSPLAEHKQSPGAAASQWLEDVEAMDGYFARYWPQKILALVSPLIILCVVAWINWLCALLLLLSAPLIPLFMILVGMGAERLNQKYSITRQRLAGHFLNRVANLTTIKLFKAQTSAFEEVQSRSAHYRQVIMKTLRVAFLSSAVLEFFTSIAIASLAIYIGFSLYGAIKWGPATSINLFSGLLILILAPEFFQPLRMLSQYYHDKAAAVGAADNLVDLFNADMNTNMNADISSQYSIAHVNNKHEIEVPKTCEYRLQLNNVAIAYSHENVLVKNINVELKGNQLLAITGPSGSGKSTLLNTIANYLPAIEGDIHISPNRDAYAPIAYLPQKPWIKNATLLENITEFAPSASEQQILSCLSMLGLADELSTRENGLNILLGEHGQGLSGGQMQRIALSRILLNPTPVVLLDEPTAKLDIYNKALVIKALRKLKQNAIVLVATHDSAIIDMADGCLALDETGANDNAVLV